MNCRTAAPGNGPGAPGDQNWTVSGQVRGAMVGQTCRLRDSPPGGTPSTFDDPSDVFPRVPHVPRGLRPAARHPEPPSRSVTRVDGSRDTTTHSRSRATAIPHAATPRQRRSRREQVSPTPEPPRQRTGLAARPDRPDGRPWLTPADPGWSGGGRRGLSGLATRSRRMTRMRRTARKARTPARRESPLRRAAAPWAGGRRPSPGRRSGRRRRCGRGPTAPR